MKLAFVIYNLSHLDNWIKPLSKYTDNNEIIVFHLAKIQNKTFPVVHNNIKEYDLSQISGQEIINILKYINPDICIFLNFRSMFEFLLQRICIHNNIKQIYLEHGLFSQNTLHFMTSRAKRNIKSTICRQYNLWKKYLGFLFCSKALTKELKILEQIYLKRNFSASPFDHYIVYSQREKDLLSKVFNMNNKNTSLVGYPIFNDKQEKTRLIIQHNNNNEVLYVHQPFILDGFATINYEQEKTYLISLKNILLRKYDRFTILLHPRENLSAYIRRFEDTDINIIQSPKDCTCYTNKSLILGHYSTALFYALYFDIPTVILNYPTVKNDPIYEECFETISDIKALLIKDFKTNPTKKIYMLGEINTYEYIANKIIQISNQ